MKILFYPFFFLFFLSSLSFAQNEKLTKEIDASIATALEVARQNGVVVKVETLTTSAGNLKNYSALRILPSSHSAANREALSMNDTYGGLKLYFSPYDLKRSNSEAFFKPDGSHIGVPADFLTNPFSESYLHEKIHATTYLNLIQSMSDTYAGVFRLVLGEQLSSKNSNGYLRHASLDEFLATLYSAKFNCFKLYDIYLKSTPSQFLRAEENEELLSDVKFNLDTGAGLSAQAADLIERALPSIENQNFTLQKTKITLGDRLSKEVFLFKVLVDSYERRVLSGRGRTDLFALPNGSELHFYSRTNDVQVLKNRLQAIRLESKNREQIARSVLKNIGLRVLYADLETTSVKNLYQACQAL